MNDATANLPDEYSGLVGQSQARIAAAFNISERLVRDAGWLLRNAPPEIVAEIEAGRMTIHKAMKLCGRRVQGDRNNEFKQTVARLCELVLNDDFEGAKQSAAEIYLKLAGK